MIDAPATLECEIVVTTYDRDFRYGGYSVGQMERIDLHPLAPLTDGEILLPGDLLFLDTETTGLTGGAVAFLLGVGHFCENGFIIKQYLMRDYDEELSLLTGLNAEIGARGSLVTYNGKAYDINLLESRFIMNGIRFPKTTRHIDLLRPARRIWRRCIENCRLVTIEGEILGERRVEDIPGYLIPQTYFDFLETREYAVIEAVLLHNRLDVLAMAAVLKYISDLSERAGRREPYDTSSLNAAGAISSGKLADRAAEELLGLAGFFYSMGDVEKAEACLLMSLERDKPAVNRRALMALAEMKKRERKYSDAAEYWKRLLAYSPSAGPYPYIELAKHYEHKARDCVTAMEYTEQARLLVSGPVYKGAAINREIETRKERLARKIDRLSKGKVLTH